MKDNSEDIEENEEEINSMNEEKGKKKQMTMIGNKS